MNRHLSSFIFRLLSLSEAVFCLSTFSLTMSSCNPEAAWVTDNVDITMNVEMVSAAFIQCSYTTTRDAYYLIAVEPVRKGVDPMSMQKQFMTLALDSANTKYIQWRNKLLKEGEFNIAPFASHALQYGATTRFFTGLWPGNDYWVYAFLVNPSTMQPVGKLHLQTVHTADESAMNIHFDYRVRDDWDYIYPLDSTGKIFNNFPYIATTRDSVELAEEEWPSPAFYFRLWVLEAFLKPDSADVYYGVKVINNDGIRSHTAFEEGKTYYTAIGGFDGPFKQLAVYKFTWTEGCEFYFHDTDSTNLAITETW